MQCSRNVNQVEPVAERFPGLDAFGTERRNCRTHTSKRCNRERQVCLRSPRYLLRRVAAASPRSWEAGWQDGGSLA